MNKETWIFGGSALAVGLAWWLRPAPAESPSLAPPPSSPDVVSPPLAPSQSPNAQMLAGFGKVEPVLARCQWVAADLQRRLGDAQVALFRCQRAAAAAAQARGMPSAPGGSGSIPPGSPPVIPISGLPRMMTMRRR